MRCYNCGHLRRSHVKILQYIIFLFHIFSCFNVYFYQNFVHIAATDFWLFLLFFFVCVDGGGLCIEVAAKKIHKIEMYIVEIDHIRTCPTFSQDKYLYNNV